MAITSGVCNSFKQECMLAIHDMDTDNIRIALYTDAATLDASTTTYSATNEVSGTGYTAGGELLANVSVALSGSTAVLDFDNVTWAAATIIARGALIYNASKANRAIAVYDFSENKSSSAGDFVLSVPVADAANAIVRLA